MTWRLFVETLADARAQMARDEGLAQEAQPVLRLFRWVRPAFSVGYKQPLPGWMDRQALNSAGVDVVERPTGGGIAVHGSDVSCAIVMPHASAVALETLMGRIAESFVDALRHVGVASRWIGDAASAGRIDYCLTQASPYAVMVEDRKLCGFAIRRYAQSWLIQGSLLVRHLPMVIEHVLPVEVLETYRRRAASVEEMAGHMVADHELEAQLIQAWRRRWGMPTPTEPVLEGCAATRASTTHQW